MRRLLLMLLVLGLVGGGIGALAATAFFDPTEEDPSTPLTDNDLINAQELDSLESPTPSPSPSASPSPRPVVGAGPVAAASPTLDPNRDPREPRTPRGAPGAFPENTPVPKELAAELKECQEEETEEDIENCEDEAEADYEKDHPS
ncbi:MAG: hypothetical protein WD646_04675 [Actinomycetota bacterium]